MVISGATIWRSSRDQSFVIYKLRLFIFIFLQIQIQSTPRTEQSLNDNGIDLSVSCSSVKSCGYTHAKEVAKNETLDQPLKCIKRHLSVFSFFKCFRTNVG